jgi:ketosteroid isomerase-like protein
MSTMSTSTQTILTHLFTSISTSGFRETFLNALSDDVIWTATGSSPLSGRYEGKREYVEKVLQPLHDRLEASPRPEVERIIVDSEWAAVLFRSSGARGLNGVDFSMQYCWLMKVVDERITEVVGFYDQKKMCDLFG